MSGNRNKAQPKLGEGVHPPHRRPVLTLETSEAVDLTHMHEGKDPEGAHAPANDLPPVDLQPESQNMVPTVGLGGREDRKPVPACSPSVGGVSTESRYGYGGLTEANYGAHATLRPDGGNVWHQAHQGNHQGYMDHIGQPGVGSSPVPALLLNPLKKATGMKSHLMTVEELMGERGLPAVVMETYSFKAQVLASLTLLPDCCRLMEHLMDSPWAVIRRELIGVFSSPNQLRKCALHDLTQIRFSFESPLTFSVQMRAVGMQMLSAGLSLSEWFLALGRLPRDVFGAFVRSADEAARGQKLSTWEDLSLRDLCEAMSATMEQVAVTEKYKPHLVPKPGPMDRVFFAGEEEPGQEPRSKRLRTGAGWLDEWKGKFRKVFHCAGPEESLEAMYKDLAPGAEMKILRGRNGAYAVVGSVDGLPPKAAGCHVRDFIFRSEVPVPGF